MNTPNHAKTFCPAPLAILSAAAACAIAGCSDPADKAAKTTAIEPKQIAQPTANAKDYILHAESKIEFVGSKVTGSHAGGFKRIAGRVSVANGVVGAAEVKIDMDSTWSDTERLTEHLKSPDFFDVAKYPTATFTASSIAASNAQHRVIGNLSLRGITKSISFPAEIQVTDDVVTVKSEFAINRKDFNINYPGKPNDLIRDNVVLNLDIKATPGEPRPQYQLTN